LWNREKEGRAIFVMATYIFRTFAFDFQRAVWALKAMASFLAKQELFEQGFEAQAALNTGQTRKS
jgi:hypothetical protein